MPASDVPRKKSPRAPSIALEEALEKVSKVYDKERMHPAPADVVAQHMGYKDANSGRALGALASLRYYGLLERHGTGLLSVTKDVENYRFAPNEELRRAYLLRFLAAPPLFAELLDRYASGLPSDGNLRYDLIQRGFLPATAESLVAVIRKSAAFSNAFGRSPTQVPGEPADTGADQQSEEDEAVAVEPPPPVTSAASVASPRLQQQRVDSVEDAGHDRIPVRLTGGRRAWLLIPHEFREADKARIKAQIDLLLTEDDES